MTSVLIVAPDISDNSTGRAYVWWLLARHLGWQVSCVSYFGDKIWAPLANSEFASDCEVLGGIPASRRSSDLADRTREHDFVIAVKPLPRSLGVAIAARRRRSFGLIVDIDDPDLEARLSRGPYWKRLAWRVVHMRFWLSVRTPSAIAKNGPIAVSNPALQSIYGGSIVPHARQLQTAPPVHTRTRPVVAFVGTARLHKGIAVLREAINGLQDKGVRLVVTADPPADAQPWESWVGEGSVEEGEKIVRSSDIVALPSLPGSFAYGQLPAKLIDAMMLGRVTVVSDIQPMGWAVGSADLCVTPGSVQELESTIRRLCDPSVRAEIADTLHRRATSLFSVEAVAPALLSLADQLKRTRTHSS